MEKLKNIIKYFLLKQKDGESKCVELMRVALFLYLVDWRSAIKQDKTMTGINWSFSKNNMQDSDEIEQAISDETMFALGKDDTIPARDKRTITCIDTTAMQNFDVGEIDVFNRVIEITDGRNVIELLIFALSTYPVISATEEIKGDILEKAHEYKQLRKNSQT